MRRLPSKNLVLASQYHCRHSAVWPHQRVLHQEDRPSADLCAARVERTCLVRPRAESRSVDVDQHAVQRHHRHDKGVGGPAGLDVDGGKGEPLR